MARPQAATGEWDCIIVGTGMGGSVFGLMLARAGRRVLFIEQGRHYLRNPERLGGNYAETFFKPADFPHAKHADLLSRAGRYAEPVTIQNDRGGYTHIPFIGSGTGGSTALYGMALERFFPADFTPRLKHPAASIKLPERWPFSYQDIAPFYASAEQLFQIRGSADPLKSDMSSGSLVPGPPLTPLSDTFFRHFQSKGLHPYAIPMACLQAEDCQVCQSYLCQKGCKQDAATVALEPAIQEHGATLWDRCRVTRLEASANRVEHIVCEREGKTFSATAPLIVLAAGALNSARLLLASSNSHWPRGLANRSDQVGRNLMRHYTDLYAVTPTSPGDNRPKQIAFNDFYADPSGALGTVQSFGRLPPASILAESLKADLAKGRLRPIIPLYQLIKPILRGALAKLVDTSMVFATICEDLPSSNNRIQLHNGGIQLRYTLDAYDQGRVATMRERMKSVLSPYRHRLIKAAEDPGLLAHVCGTCRAGNSPDESVVDKYNRCHDVENLYIVDASFFPTSGGTNPALTIAANAMRVADYLIHRTK